MDALNLGFSQARGAYVARMDADDVALPGRLRRQVEILDSRPEIDMVHTAVRIIDGQGRVTGELGARTLDRAQRTAILLAERPGTPIVHPTVMVRRHAMEAAGGYRHSPSCEDTELWLRVVDHWGIAAIEEPLLLYRQHEGGISRERALEQAISGLTNWSAHRYRMATGIDLQSADPVRHAALRERIAKLYGPHLEALCRIRAFRRKIRERKLVEAALLFVRVFFSGQVMSISGRIERRGLVDIQHRLLARLLAEDERISTR